MPACKITVGKKLEEDEVRKTEYIPLSNHTLSLRINDMTHHTEDVLFDKLKKGNFFIQVEKSTDLTSKCCLLAFVRLVDEREIRENFLCCKELLKTSRGIDIFNISFAYLEKYLSYKNCIAICADGDTSMVGSIKRLFYSLA
ncbi:uncharacterized protein NPIL_409771 [Nephila pilipes]|uniref:Uncharacterized protein n=1 Tax=Nephila pilipes TaxID=299642 RepID=A0A8X6T9R3_NEPPI|nr:uncharacterized protein NPIL_409771 [Nephila pilipes]